MKIETNITVHGNPKAKKLWLMFPIEGAAEPFCWNAPFFFRADDEKGAIREAHKTLNDGAFGKITKSQIEENNEFSPIGNIVEGE